jgi:hypothetical protein
VLRLLWKKSGHDIGDREAGSIILAINHALNAVRFGRTDDEAIAHLANKIVRKELDKGAITYKEYKTWRAVNPFIFTPVIDSSNQLIGFFDVFPLKPEAGKAVLGGTLTERTMTAASLVPVRDIGTTTHIHIATILLNPRQKTFPRIVAKELLLLKLKQFFQERYEPLEERTFTAYAQTRAGEALLKRCGFSMAIVADDNKEHWPLYVLQAGDSRAAVFRFERADSNLAARSWAETWDARLHAVERTLRTVIDSLLNGDATLLPPHILEKVNKQLQSVAKKNAAISVKQYEKLVAKLEYCDLRELQETILSKSLWPRFKDLFANQESLFKKFDQLCEARNGIRHSRTLDQITQREGEAAILWFEAVLQRL